MKRTGSQAQIPSQVSESPTRSATLVGSQLNDKSKSKPKPTPAEDSETEDESEYEADVALAEAGVTKVHSRKNTSPPLSIPASGHQDDSDHNGEESQGSRRIIGFSHPLADFKRTSKRETLFRRLWKILHGGLIKEILLKPFASRRHSELLECMRELRLTCLNVSAQPFVTLSLLLIYVEGG